MSISLNWIKRHHFNFSPYFMTIVPARLHDNLCLLHLIRSIDIVGNDQWDSNGLNRTSQYNGREKHCQNKGTASFSKQVHCNCWWYETCTCFVSEKKEKQATEELNSIRVKDKPEYEVNYWLYLPFLPQIHWNQYHYHHPTFWLVARQYTVWRARVLLLLQRRRHLLWRTMGRPNYW